MHHPPQYIDEHKPFTSRQTPSGRDQIPFRIPHGSRPFYPGGSRHDDLESIDNILDFSSSATGYDPPGEPTYTISYTKNPFHDRPELEWTGMSWDFVRKFALGNVHPAGWTVVEEATGEELDLEEIGTAYHHQPGAELNS